jgi:hypothetical protein
MILIIAHNAFRFSPAKKVEGFTAGAVDDVGNAIGCQAFVKIIMIGENGRCAPAGNGRCRIQGVLSNDCLRKSGQISYNPVGRNPQKSF